MSDIQKQKAEISFNEQVHVEYDYTKKTKVEVSRTGDDLDFSIMYYKEVDNIRGFEDFGSSQFKLTPAQAISIANMLAKAASKDEDEDAVTFTLTSVDDITWVGPSSFDRVLGRDAETEESIVLRASSPPKTGS